MKLLTHFQTSTVQPLKFEHAEAISSHTLLGMWLLINAKVKVKLLKLNYETKRSPCWLACIDIVSAVISLYGICISFMFILTGCNYLNPHNSFDNLAILISTYMASESR